MSQSSVSLQGEEDRIGEVDMKEHRHLCQLEIFRSDFQVCTQVDRVGNDQKGPKSRRCMRVPEQKGLR